jgi:hypothetical protein
MFNRIRYAAEVISYSPPKAHPRDVPDIVFEQETREDVSKMSKAIGGFVEIMLISIVIGVVAAPVSHFILRGHEHLSVTTIAGIAASLLTFGSQHLLHDLNARIRLKLKIGERIAPFFGHTIMRTVNTLRG